MSTERRTRALDSLTGLAVGDALGSRFLVPAARADLLARRTPPGPWRWTDDTEMACSVVAILIRHGRIEQESLAESFAARHDPARGYGGGANDLLRRVRAGADWRESAAAQFDGQGSWGNGSVMRVAPLGAWFADDLHRVAEEAALSALVTHTHPDAVAGAVAVAIASATSVRGDCRTPVDFLSEVLRLTPPGPIRDGIASARDHPPGTSPELVAARLGNGERVACRDTVPFVVWAAANNFDDYEEALRSTAGVGGDVDTTCAVVGGIVGANVGTVGIPSDWRSACEEFPDWFECV
jgi:ADP-ribosylglycohydrolase